MRQINAASTSGGGGGGGSTIDRELVVTTYSVKTAFSGASVGDTVTCTQIIDVTSAPYSVSTIWRNQTTDADLASAPNAANLTLIGSGSLSDAQLRASPVPVTQTGSATAALQSQQLTALQGIQNNIPPIVNGRQPVSARNTRTVFREQGVSYTPNAVWQETARTGGALIFNDGNAVGSGYVVLSLDPIDPTSAGTIEVPLSASMPIELVTGLSLSQRTIGQEFSLELVSTVADPAAPADLVISSIQQATTTLTVTTATAHGLRVGDQIGIRDCTSDSRLNYSALVVATTPTATQFTATSGPAGAIASVTAGPFSTGFVYRRQPMAGNLHGTALVFENASATNGTVHVRGGEGNVLPTGTVAGNQSLTIGSTASVQAVNAALNYAFQPTNEFRLIAEPHRLQWLDSAVDAVSVINPRTTRTQVCPSPDLQYRIRARALNYAALTRPVAQIVQVVKSGTTTATVTTSAAHGLTVGDYVNTYGVRDTTNFANLTTATVVASVIDATTFTIVWGAAVTATSFGGYVARVNGGQAMQGALTMVAQSVSRTSNVVTLVGSASWSGALIGDLVNLVGVRDASAGASLGLDGSYRIRDIQTTNLFLEPVGNAPTGADITSTNCGGGVIKRTDLRLHFVKAFEFERERFEFAPRGSTEAFGSMPVAVTNTPAVTVSSGTITTVTTVTTVSAVTSANLGIPGTIADVASAALTTTTTTSAFTPTYGTSFQVNVPVTAVSGTSPTLDFSIDESDDSGTNWFRVYDFPRITATGMYRSPKLPLTGNRVRYVQTVGGTSPSFTRAVNRLQGSDDTPAIRQIVDRTVSLTTLNSATPSLNIQNSRNVQLVINLGAATTPPALQLEGSDDNGASWYAIGSPLTGVASSSVQLTVNNVQAQLLRARVSTVGATVTAGYVLIKGF